MAVHPKTSNHPKSGTAKFDPPLIRSKGDIAPEPAQTRLDADNPGVRIPRAGRFVRASEMTPWMRAMYAVLADGKWHEREELLAAGGELVPAERAYQTEIARLARRSQISGRTKPHHVAAGRRFLASQALLSAVRWEGAERKNDRFRMTKVARNAWKSHEKAAAFEAKAALLR